MRLLLTNVHTPIGIDVGSRCVKAVQATVRGKDIVHGTLATMPLENGAAWSEAAGHDLAEMLRRRKFIGRQVALAAPPELLKVEAVELPKVEREALGRLAEMEIARAMRLRARTFEHGLWELPSPSRGGNAMHVMTAALPHSDADKLCGPLQKAGLEVVAICPQLSALAVLAQQIVPESAQMHTLVDIGSSSTRLIILQEGKVLFHRAISGVGMGSLEEAVGMELQAPAAIVRHLVTHVGTSGTLEGMVRVASRMRRIFDKTAESIAAELQLTENYIGHRYQQQTSPDLFLLGGGAAAPGLSDALSAATRRRTRVLAPAQFQMNHQGSDNPGYLPALACALYAMEAGR